MTFPLIVGLTVFLITVTVGGWATIRYWHGRGLDGKTLQLHRARVRMWGGLICLGALTLTIIYWRFLASGTLGYEPGLFLIPMGAIVSLLGVVSARGLWFQASSPLSRLHWLDSVPSWYRVSVQAGFVAIVSFVTVLDIEGAGDQRSTVVLTSFTALSAMVALGSAVLGWQIPRGETYPVGDPNTQLQVSNWPNRANSNYAGSVYMRFAFAEHARGPWVLYLAYFSHFLKDLGVEVTTELKDEAGSVLISVTPADENDPLDDIRDALSLYLRLPFFPREDTTNEAIEVQRLEATILRLQSDLKLAQAELQARNMTIEAQQMIINLLQEDNLLAAVKDSGPKPEEPKPEDKEDVIPGILSLGTLEGKGIKINLGEIFRRLKRLFARKKE